MSHCDSKISPVVQHRLTGVCVDEDAWVAGAAAAAAHVFAEKAGGGSFGPATVSMIQKRQ